MIDTGQRKSFVAMKDFYKGAVLHQKLGHIPVSVIRNIDMFANKRNFQLQCCNICPLSRKLRLPTVLVVLGAHNVLIQFTWMYGDPTRLQLIVK